MNNQLGAFLRDIVHILLNPLNSLLIIMLATLVTIFRIALHFYERTRYYTFKEARSFYIMAVTIILAWSIVCYLILGNTPETWRSIALTIVIGIAIMIGQFISIVIIQTFPDQLQDLEDEITKVLNRKVPAAKSIDCGAPCAEEKTVSIIKEVIAENREAIKNIMGIL